MAGCLDSRPLVNLWVWTGSLLYILKKERFSSVDIIEETLEVVIRIEGVIFASLVL